MFLTGRHLSRREVLKGIGATVALPVLDAMTPAGRVLTAAEQTVRLICVEMVHGTCSRS